jgi:hypothetical protein
VTGLWRARAQAIRTSRPVRASMSTESGSDGVPLVAPLFLPDGRAIGPGADPLTGVPDAAP